MGTWRSEEQSLHMEVADLAAALRATLDWYSMTGADGIPTDLPAPWAPGPVWPEPSAGALSIERPRTLEPARSEERSSRAEPSRAAARPEEHSSHAEPSRAAPSSGHPPATRGRPPAPEHRAAQAPVRHPRGASSAHENLGEGPVAPRPLAVPQTQGAEGAQTDLTRGQVLEQIDAEVKACRACCLCQARTQTVFSRGTGSSGLCFVGEGPGADEDAQGKPFVGAAGQLLDRMVAAMGLSRDEVYVCNIVKCRPPGNRKPTTEEMATCVPFLHRQLEALSPLVVVALGGTAVEGLLGITVGITRLRGTWKLYKGRVAVMPTFHPAYLLRSPGAKKEVWDDLQAVLRHMGRSVPSRK